MIKINSEKELMNFLKIIAEEAVSKSKNILEKDPFIKDFAEKQEKNKSLYEQEEEAENEPEETKPEETEGEQANAEKEDKNKLTPAAEKALSLPSYKPGQIPDFDILLSAINLVRAGNSLKDKKVKSELKDYYDRLDKNEKSVLILFLKELAKITTLAVDGDDAQDPSDRSAYFNITIKNPKDTNSQETVLKKDMESGDRIDTKIKAPQPEKQIGLEDTTPPIKVNESQDLRNIRAKIRELMNS